MTERTEYIQSLERGLAVLTAFGEKNPEMTLADAARVTGYTRATVRRILFTLRNLGYVTENERHLWSLTPRVLEIGFSFLSSMDMWEVAYPYMREVSEVSGEACSITVLDGDSSVYVARVPANRVMAVTLGIGARLPAWLASHGRVHLSQMPEAELARYLRKQARQPRTEKTIWDVNELVRVIKQVEADGYCLVTDELELGLLALAVPIFDRRGNIQASIHISTHSSRTSEEKALSVYLPALQRAAEQIKLATA